MKRINSFAQKLASIAPKAAPPAISSIWNTHKVTYRLLPLLAALAMAGSLSAAAICSPAQLAQCNAEGYAACGISNGVVCSAPYAYRKVCLPIAISGFEWLYCWSGPLIPPTAISQMRPVLPGSIIDAFTKLASENESREQTARLSSLAGSFSAAVPGQSRSFTQQPIIPQARPLSPDSTTDASTTPASPK